MEKEIFVIIVITLGVVCIAMPKQAAQTLVMFIYPKTNHVKNQKPPRPFFIRLMGIIQIGLGILMYIK